MSQHRIFGSEADQPKPLAYVRMFRPHRRRYRGYVAAAAIGLALTVIVGAAWVLVQGGLVSTVH